MTFLEMYKKSTLEAALNEFDEKYDKFCESHTCDKCEIYNAATKAYPLWYGPKCKPYVIDHLVEANAIMDDVLKKEAEAKKKKENTAKYLVCAIKAEKRDLEYRAKRDADYVILNPDDYALLKSCTTERLTLCLSDSFSYAEICGMRIICDPSIKRGEFVIGFKADSHLHIKEATE